MPNTKTQTPDVHHVPVMLEEVLTFLKPEAGESYLDLTAGLGGHAGAVLDKTLAADKAVLVDRDPQAAANLKKKLPGASVLNQDFFSSSKQLLEAGQRFDLILADLGVSSLHLNDPARGFSFMSSGPLDMRMDPSQELTAGQIVNDWPAAKLEALLRASDEPRANRIAQGIVASRPITDTLQLAAVVKRVYPAHSRRHPATKTFQALRLAVNDELGQIEQSLPLWIELLNPGGRLAVISFHSLEDRLVKQAFADRTGGYDAELELLAKHPVVPSEAEIDINPRARSAKLRAVAKIKTKERI
jgi:16S rRNA (cytosine1402-N4)-methyltransferase